MYLGHDQGVSEAVSWIAGRTRCGMFHSVELAKAIHGERVREMERVLRDRRLLEPASDAAQATLATSEPGRAIRVAATPARGSSACEPV
jgi:hypothetical protein